MEFIKVILTSLLSAGSLFLIAKITGHKQVAQLDFFDYITGITIGSIAAELATELEEPWKPLVAMIIYGMVALGLTIVAHKFPKIRKYVNGTPTIVMDDGKLYRGSSVYNYECNRVDYIRMIYHSFMDYSVYCHDTSVEY